MYPELMVIPMREELVRAGIKETRTAEEVDAALAEPGTTLLVVNSICGCAAGKARPGIRLCHPARWQACLLDAALRHRAVHRSAHRRRTLTRLRRILREDDRVRPLQSELRNQNGLPQGRPSLLL